jgi:hypothetical protein
VNKIERSNLIKDAVNTAKKIITAKKASIDLLNLESELRILNIDREWIGTKKVEVAKIKCNLETLLKILLLPIISEANKTFAYDFTISQLELDEGCIELRVIKNQDTLVFTGERYLLYLDSGIMKQVA